LKRNLFIYTHMCPHDDLMKHNAKNETGKIHIHVRYNCKYNKYME